MQTSLLDLICEDIGQSRGQLFSCHKTESVGGGCISQALLLDDGVDRYFVKCHEAVQAQMFVTELRGLQALGECGALRVPQPLCTGTAQGSAYLVLEWLDMGGRGSYTEMGQALARLHRSSQSHAFGFQQDNFIGATPQPNSPCEDWTHFFFSQRLDYQVKLAEGRGGRFPQYQIFREKGRALLENHSVVPSLVHGDLWSGNAAFLRDGTPSIFDPAAYYGDREVDLAMSRLFGGFPDSFYEAYDREWPLERGWELRVDLYNLYHILNHFNLFGGHYQAQANRIISTLLSHCQA